MMSMYNTSHNIRMLIHKLPVSCIQSLPQRTTHAFTTSTIKHVQRSAHHQLSIKRNTFKGKH